MGDRRLLGRLWGTKSLVGGFDGRAPSLEV